MELVQSKSELRKQCLKTRSLAAENCNVMAAQARLLRHLQEIPALETIAGYWPMRNEIDPRPVLEDLHRQGIAICLPVVGAKDTPLSFRLWQPDTAMIDGAYGAQIPAVAAQAEPDALIVPLLAFDTSGHRLGYGGGYYDRTLQALRRQRRIYAIGFAYGAQMTADLPVGPYDQRLDVVITENETLVPG